MIWRNRWRRLHDRAGSLVKYIMQKYMLAQKNTPTHCCPYITPLCAPTLPHSLFSLHYPTPLLPLHYPTPLLPLHYPTPLLPLHYPTPLLPLHYPVLFKPRPLKLVGITYEVFYTVSRKQSRLQGIRGVLCKETRSLR